MAISSECCARQRVRSVQCTINGLWDQFAKSYDRHTHIYKCIKWCTQKKHRAATQVHLHKSLCAPHPAISGKQKRRERDKKWIEMKITPSRSEGMEWEKLNKNGTLGKKITQKWKKRRKKRRRIGKKWKIYVYAKHIYWIQSTCNVIHTQTSHFSSGKSKGREVLSSTPRCAAK